MRVHVNQAGYNDHSGQIDNLCYLFRVFGFCGFGKIGADPGDFPVFQKNVQAGIYLLRRIDDPGAGQ